MTLRHALRSTRAQLALAAALLAALTASAIALSGSASGSPGPIAHAAAYPSNCSDQGISPTRDATRPLINYGSSQSPLAGVRFSVDGPYYSPAGQQLMADLGLGSGYAYRNTSWNEFMRQFGSRIQGDTTMRLLLKIASQGTTERITQATGEGLFVGVRGIFCRTENQDPGGIPQILVYGLNHSKCGGYSDSSADQSRYHSFVDQIAQGIGRYPVVVYYEFDALLTVGCLSHHGLSVRLSELKYGISKLSALPHTVVYVDAGAADGGPGISRLASYLKSIGVSRIAGFFLNGTHFDWTQNEVSYGQKLSRKLHGAHFVVSTAVNGRGPKVPRDRVHQGSEYTCNPPGRGLGIPPTGSTGIAGVDGFVWIGRPGMSGGNGPKCFGSRTPIGRFDQGYAVGLAQRANEQYGPHTPSRPY
jgi:endoglucanase